MLSYYMWERQEASLLLSYLVALFCIRMESYSLILLLPVASFALFTLLFCCYFAFNPT